MMDMNHVVCAMKKKMKPSTAAITLTLGVALGATLVSVAAVSVWNSKQMRAARRVKSAENMLWRVGTAMRDVSGLEKD